jgi:hypothetical protein
MYHSPVIQIMECQMNEIKTKLTEGGDELILRLEGGEVRIFTPRQAVKHAQELVRQYIPQGRLLSDELLAERHLESYTSEKRKTY